ncbi:MAG: ATP-binding protein [bacterium]|nr:ATP-binding protein [bacterium]
MVYKRRIEEDLKSQIKTEEVVILTGMRRTGKTTLMKTILSSVESSNKVFLDLENPLNRRIFEEKNYDNILKNLEKVGISSQEKMYVFLDEIQLMSQIPSAIKYLHDNFDVKFFLTGSSSYYLKNLFSESLSGRKIIFELYPLDFEEYLVFKGEDSKIAKEFLEKSKNKNEIVFEQRKKYYDEYLRYGGFPGVVLEKDLAQKEKKISDIFTSYFEQDVKMLADFRDLSKLRDLIILLAARTGSKLEITKLASEMGVSRETIYNYLSFLEKTYFIFLISPFSRNSDREVSGARKVYLCDTGILYLLGGASDGSIFENAAFLNLKKYGKINYYQKRSGTEIDFILNKETGFEVKNKGNNSDLKKLNRISQSLKLKEYYVVSRKYSEEAGIIIAADL